MTTNGRRSPGTGHVFSYTVQGEIHYGIKFDLPAENGKRKQVMRRRDQHGNPWLTKKAAHTALHRALHGDRSVLVQGPGQTWACLVSSCLARSVTDAPVLLCAEHRDLLLAQLGRRKLAHDPLVYFLRNGNRIKIGWTTNLKRRAEQLALPMAAVAATMPGGSAEEAALHRRFSGSRTHARYEWFESTPELEAFMASLQPSDCDQVSDHGHLRLVREGI